MQKKKKKKGKETRGMLFLDKNASKKGQRLDTRVYCCWTCLGKSEERERRDRQRERDSERKTERKKGRQKGGGQL